LPTLPGKTTAVHKAILDVTARAQTLAKKMWRKKNQKRYYETFLPQVSKIYSLLGYAKYVKRIAGEIMKYKRKKR
jgi:hypothetical protein